MGEERFSSWKYPEFNEQNMTRWMWMCQYHENLHLETHVDIGAFTYINARYGVSIQKDVQIGSHCSIYSHSTIDDKKGKILIKENARIGTHSTIMPGITIGKNAIVGAYSFVNKDIPDNCIALGVPAKIVKEV